MEFLKALFEGKETMSYEELEKAIAEKGLKLADLSTGNYVAKKKFDDEIEAKDTAIKGLKDQLSTRDNDIKGLQEQLAGAGDDATKLADVTNQLEKLKGDYDNAKKDYETNLSKQQYEFMVREFAGEQEFSSKAAKRDFINEMISAGLKVKNNEILGANDFVSQYKEANTDAFVVAKEPETKTEPPKPNFVNPQTNPSGAGNKNPFDGMFNFTGVR